MAIINQDIQFHSLEKNSIGRLASLLEISDPPFLSPGAAVRQLNNIERCALLYGCKTVVIERHYVDRDYIEDHSIFYASTLYPYKNFCQRVHFFLCDEATVEASVKSILTASRRKKQDRRHYDYQIRCLLFSRRHYFGFSIIRPLHGSPVGRTVLRPPAKKPEISFPSTHDHKVHLFGIELTVDGLAFQQQDTGVSACATTAVWSSLQKSSSSEPIGIVTPAKITTYASQYSLAVGRSMPSGGLSIDQMSQSIQSFGVAPSLYRLTDFDIARKIIYSATSSGVAPILILEMPAEERAHAVVVAGVKRGYAGPSKYTVSTTNKAKPGDNQILFSAEDLDGLYIHDDRHVPYLFGEVRRGPHDEVLLKLNQIRKRNGETNGGGEEWQLTYLLAPIYPSVRLSFAGLQEVAAAIARRIEAYRRIRLKELLPENLSTTIRLEPRIERSQSYIQNLAVTPHGPTLDCLKCIVSSLSMSRYIAVVGCSSSYFGSLDVIIDTTDVFNNTRCVGIIIRDRTAKTIGITEDLSRFLATKYDTQLIV